jgi:L-threonylcarbamoyladenylate synthase
MKLVTWQDATERLREGEVGVIPTDTIYGIVGSALKPETVERIYSLRQRELDKPMIILIAGMDDLERFKIRVAGKTAELLEKIWPGPVSVVLPAPDEGLKYLHRGKNSLALRMPSKPELRELLRQSGPLVAPSANLAGQEAASGPTEAYRYFGDQVFYVDGGELKNPPSALVDAHEYPPRILRPAAGFKIPE